MKNFQMFTAIIIALVGFALSAFGAALNILSVSIGGLIGFFMGTISFVCLYFESKLAIANEKIEDLEEKIEDLEEKIEDMDKGIAYIKIDNDELEERISELEDSK